MVRCNFKIFIVSVFLLFLVSFTPSLLADQKVSNQPSKTEVIQKTQKLQIPFIANDGQTNEKVKFYANTFGGTVFVTKDGEIVYSLPASKSGELRDKMSEARSRKLEAGIQNVDARKQNKNLQTANSKSETQNLNPQSEIQGVSIKENISPRPLRERDRVRGVSLKEELVGGKIHEVKGEEKSVTKVDYFKGKDTSKWKTNIATYELVNLGEVYEGIELKLKAYGSNVEKLFCVKPGADPQQIKVRLSGVNPAGNPPPESPSVRGTGGCPPLAGVGGGSWARGLWVNEHGELEVETELGAVKFTKPVACQEIKGKREDVSVEYRIQKSELNTKSTNSGSQNPKSAIQNLSSTEIGERKFEYGFKVASYDKTKPLIIDPLLASTYLGASGSNSDGSDYGNAIAIGSDGSIYVAGYTDSSDFPTTTGAYDASYNGNGDYDLFISKLSGDLTSLLASTYLGGSYSDYGNSIAIDSSGNVYVTGYTYSSNFPTTAGAYNTSYNDYDVFLSKLNGDLTILLASTYLGGSESDEGNSIVIDKDGNIYVTGTSWSSNFPTTTGAYDTSYSGWGDAFLAKLNGDLSSLIASTFLGGDLNDYGNNMAIDSSGSVYVTGETNSLNFPITIGVPRSNDVFVSRLNGDLTNLLASTRLGGSSEDSGVSIAIDSDGNIYIIGQTYSPDFPTTTNAYDTFYNDASDAFVLKLNRDLTSLLASTYLGGSSTDKANSITIDSGGNIYIAGYTGSSDFPTTTGAYDASSGGGDVFVSKLNGDLTSLLASTRLGGYSSDNGNSVAIDSVGNIYVTGNTGSSDFPITTGAYNISYNGGEDGDVFVSQLNGELKSLLASTYLGGTEYDDYGNSIAVDSDGNIYVTGYTNSSAFPTTTGAYDTSYTGGYDAFVSKLDEDLTSLLASTYLGGSSNDKANSITIDSGGNIYIAGYTGSSDFPTTAGAYGTSSTYGAFVSKMNKELTSLLASTYLEGYDYEDNGNSIVMAPGGNIYVLFFNGAGVWDNFDDGTSGPFFDFIVSKMNGDLTNKLASYGFEYTSNITLLKI